ncbi:hypothetical protein [Legionella rowbothamii]|uniref:hypothetical protein n=1 Tax=Legionella rowbothamii TaxID=96229 RepID=UPI001F5FE872|nr:hypothetical protein [Legionella rowbothamii]
MRLTRQQNKNTGNQGAPFNLLIMRIEGCNIKADADKRTYIFYSKQLKDKGLDEVTSLLTEMLDKHIFPNTIILNQLIKRLSQLHQPQYSLLVHKMAVTKGLANAITYNSTLDAIAKSKQPDAELAEALINEAIEQFKLDDMKNEVRLDLHGMSFGMVYFGLKSRVQQEMKAKDSISALTLIYGKGLHSSCSGEEIHPVKQAVLRVVDELSDQGVSGQENRTNQGVFELSIQPRQVQSNTFNPNHFISPGLNPHSKPFVSKSLGGTQPWF